MWKNLKSKPAQPRWCIVHFALNSAVVSMSFFDQVYSKLFNGENGISPVEEHKLLIRGKRYQTAYENWLESPRFTEIRAQIKTSIVLKQKELDQEPFVHILDTPNNKGLAIDHSEFFANGEFSFLMDWLAEKITKDFPYKLVNSDLRIKETSQSVITTERRYLKPRPQFESPIDQQFGNVILENQIKGKEQRLLKIQVNSYQDRSYSSPRHFRELMDHLFKI